MSYCVNCGVELSNTEKRCPLCDTEVVNPASPWQEPSTRPYPQRAELIMKHIDRRYVASIIGMFILIPVLVTLISDLFAGGGITWSAYVIGAGAMLYVWVVLPLAAKRFHRLTFLALDCLMIVLYLWLIATMTGGGWFIPVALPIAISATGALLALVYIFRRGRGKFVLVRIALIFVALAAVSILTEVSVSMNLYGVIELSWSLYVLIPCAVLAAVLMILESRKKFKEEVKKRLFY